MRKKYFDYKLFIEGLIQLRPLGIIFFILSFLASALPPIFFMLDLNGPNKEFINKNILMINAEAILVFYMFIVPVVMAFSIFSFLNKRKGSDFYHSTPNTRASLFLSFSASIFAYILTLCVFSVSVSTILYLSFGAIMNLSILPNIIFTFLAGSLLVLGATLIAMSITGRGVTGFLVTGLILFLPRLITTVFAYSIQSSTQLVTMSEFGILGDASYHIPVKFLLSAFLPQIMGQSIDDKILSFTPGIIYTFILAIGYIVAALVLFKNRLSESAEKSAANGVLQHLFRIAITLPITLIIPCSIIGYKSVSEFLKYNQTMLITVFILALAIYFLFEFATTRKLKNLVSAIPMFFVIIILNVLFSAVMFNQVAKIQSFKPTADEISSVRFISDHYNDGGYGVPTIYYELLLRKVEFKDAQIREKVAKALMDTIQKDPKNFFTGGGSSVSNLNVEIKTTNGKKAFRIIKMMPQDFDELKSLRAKNEQFIKIVTELPQDNEMNAINLPLNKEESKQVWSVFKEEFSALSYIDANNLCGNSYINSTAQNMETINIGINVIGTRGFDFFQGNYYLGSKTPKALKLYINLINKNSLSKAKTFINKTIETDNYYFNITAKNTSHIAFIDSIYVDKNGNDNRNVKQMLAILSKYADKEVDITKPFIEFTFAKRGAENESYMNNIVYLPIEQSDFNELARLYEEGSSQTKKY